MKMVKNISELKKGDTIIAKDCPASTSLGLKSITGDVFALESGKPNFSIRCKETNSIEKVSLEEGTIFLID